MKSSDHSTSTEPGPHCEKLGQQLDELIEHLRTDAERVTEPRFKALCETGAEVASGLRKAFKGYSQKNEPAWR